MCVCMCSYFLRFPKLLLKAKNMEHPVGINFIHNSQLV